MTISATNEESRLVDRLESLTEYHIMVGTEMLRKTMHHVFESSWAAHPEFGRVRRKHKGLLVV